MGRYEELMKLVGKHAPKVIDEAAVYGKKALRGIERAADLLDRPAATVRSGIQAYQQDRPVLESMVNQLSRPSAEAPTGDDLIEPMAEAEGYANPAKYAALSALATVGADPLNFIGGPMGKGVAKLGAKASGAFKVKKGLNAAEALLESRRTGKVVPTVASELVSPSKQLPKDLIPSKTMDIPDARPMSTNFDKIREQFPSTAKKIEEMKNKAVNVAPQVRDELDDVMDQFPQTAAAIRKLRGFE
jgi:uncharacterized protein (DUF885 family)